MIAACDAVFQHSQGVPRLINLLCDTALVYGFAEQRPRIDAQLVDEVARDKQKGGIFPSEKKKARRSTDSDIAFAGALCLLDCRSIEIGRG